MNNSLIAPSIGERISRLRQQKEITRLEMAEAGNLDVLAIIQLETDRLDPTVGDLLAIAKALGVTMPELFHGVKIN